MTNTDHIVKLNLSNKNPPPHCRGCIHYRTIRVKHTGEKEKFCALDTHCFLDTSKVVSCNRAKFTEQLELISSTHETNQG